MARNYMHDIAAESEAEPGVLAPERSIRDFRPSAARQRLQSPQRMPEARVEYEPRRRKSRVGMWIAALIVLVVLSAAGAFILFPSTTITIVPRTHVMPFDSSNAFTAYPAMGAATGTITFTVTTEIFEDSALVQANGLEKAEEKASGNITVYNETNRVLRLIKNTRFQSPDGLLFRIPASVDVAAMKGTTPGSATVTVFADQTGPSYNLAPVDKFTLPGLKGSQDYAKVYAKSAAAFTGGFSGERPAVSSAILEASKAEIRNRLNEKAQELSRTVPDGSLAFPGLVALSFETLPPANEAGGGVRIRERVTVTMPVFPADLFARAVAQAVSADAEGQSVSIRFAADISAAPVGELGAADIGQKSITFTLMGRGEIIWHVDEAAVAEVLAGREEAAFETIIAGFPAIEEARARITPFWQHAVPKDAGDIKVTVESPPEQI